MMNHGIIRITILIIPCDERYKQLISEQGRAYILKQEGVGARTTKKKKKKNLSVTHKAAIADLCSYQNLMNH